MPIVRLTLALLLMAAQAWAAPEDADRSEERARASFVDQFTIFMQDKNVQGRAKSPDGKVVGGGKKTRFNGDDGLAFQSDLTYHDYSFNSTKMDDQPKNGQNNLAAPPKTLHAHISSHGGVDAAGGSSLLERTVFGLDKKFTEADQKKEEKEEPGVKYKSIFKITTQAVIEKQGPNKGMEKDKVERFEMRPEATQEIDKVGVQSSETILQAARGQENANDPQALGNGVYLRAAAYEATKALWNSTLANLTQRRANRAIEGGILPFSVQISEGAPKCDGWAQEAQAALAKMQFGKAQMERAQKDIQRMLEQCRQIGALPYNAINPKFEKDENDQEKLTMQGPEKEDALQRDSRLQLEVMSKAGKSVTEAPSNWKYDKNADKARMTIQYDEGQPREGTRTMAEQLESYNENLKSAEEGYDEVKSRIPGMNNPKPTQYAIQPGTVNLMDINQPPASAFEEVGIERAQDKGPVPQTYDQLLMKAQTN